MRDIQSKFIPYERLAYFRDSLFDGTRVVVTNGCFDLLHMGHLNTLIQAKKLGDILIVGINSNKSVSSLKPGRPINDEIDRASLIAGLECVDYVSVFTELTFTSFLKKTKPCIYAKTGDYDTVKYKEEVDVVIKNGGKLEILDAVWGKSTTKLIEKIKNL